MAVIIHFMFKALKQRNKIVAGVTGGILAELVMIGGYLLFESVLYGFKTALVSVPFNIAQGIVGLVVGVVLINILSKMKILK